MKDLIEHPYRYALLRYVHDRRTEEFVNVGVVLECVSLGFIACKVDNSFKRLSSFFPGVSSHHLRNSFGTIQGRINLAGEKIKQRGDDIFSTPGKYLEAIWRDVLPKDDSSIAWSPVRAGIDSDPASALVRIFSKSVSSYKSVDDKKSRSDADVWSSVESQLTKFSLNKEIVEHHVQGALSEYKFSHALKNGKWHCIEPVSIDLIQPDSIRGKVQKMYGAMSLIKDSARDVKVHFVLSDPTTKAARDMYQEARNVVSSVEIPHDVILESESSRLAKELSLMIGHA